MDSLTHTVQKIGQPMLILDYKGEVIKIINISEKNNRSVTVGGIKFSSVNGVILPNQSGMDSHFFEPVTLSRFPNQHKPRRIMRVANSVAIFDTNLLGKRVITKNLSAKIPKNSELTISDIQGLVDARLLKLNLSNDKAYKIMVEKDKIIFKVDVQISESIDDYFDRTYRQPKLKQLKKVQQYSINRKQKEANDSNYKVAA